MCIPVICTFPGNPGLSEVLPRLAPNWSKHWWAWVTLSQKAQEKSCPAHSQGMVQWFPHSLQNREPLGELSSSPTTPSAALGPSAALCPTEKTQGPLARVGQLGGASCEWTWQIQVSLSLFSLAHHTAQALPRWQSSLCHDCQRRMYNDTSLHSQK